MTKKRSETTDAHRHSDRSWWRHISLLAILVPTLALTSCAASPVTPSPEATLSAPPTLMPTFPTTPTATPSDTPAATPSPVPTLTGSPSPVREMINLETVGALSPILTLSSHTDDVTDVTFSPDNALVASSSADGTVRVWNVADGSLRYKLQGHSDQVLTVAFSADGSLLASGSNDRTVRIWLMSDGSLKKTISSSFFGRALDVVFSPDGKLFAMADQLCHVELRTVDTGILRRTIIQPKCVPSAGGTVGSWGIAFTSDGGHILTAEGRPCCGGSIYTTQIEGFTNPELLRGNMTVRDIDLSPDEASLAVAFSSSATFWTIDAVNGNLLQQFEGHSYRVNSVDYSPGGELLASGSRDQNVRLWDAAEGTLLASLKDHAGEVTSVAFAPDGSLIASASADDTVILWGVE
jgi:WD40 repeat protein